MAELSAARKLPVEFVAAYFNPPKHDIHKVSSYLTIC